MGSVRIAVFGPLGIGVVTERDGRGLGKTTGNGQVSESGTRRVEWVGIRVCGKGGVGRTREWEEGRQ